MSSAQIEREAMMHWHLTGNHFPPYPAYMVLVALEAVDAVEAQEPDKIIELPEDVSYRQEPTARNLLETFHINVYECDQCEQLIVNNWCDCPTSEGE